MLTTSSSCTRCRSAIEDGDLRCPVCYQAVPPTAGPRGAGSSVRTLRCRGCGAAMEYQARLEALQCAFCGGVVALEQHDDPIEQPERRLPFTVDRAQASEAYRQWISRQGFFRPWNLASAARMESLRALYWVGWAIDADAEVTWTADSDAGARLAPWAPHAGEFEARFDDLVIPATRGLSAGECARLIPTYDLQGAVSQPAGEDFEAVHERFEIPRSAARARIAAAIQRLTEAGLPGRHVPGSRVRNARAAIRLRGLVTRRLAFPAYVLAYRYRGRLHRTVISGQDPTSVIGDVPRSVAKLLLAIAVAALALGASVIGLLLARG